MRAVRPGEIVNVLIAVIQACLRAAERRAEIEARAPLTRNSGLVRCLRESVVPEEARFVDRVRGWSGNQPNVERVIVKNL